jgi:ABC-type phosphate transport system permease subunit
MAMFTSIGTYLYGTAYIVGWSLFGALALGVIAAIWIRGGFG